MGQLERSICELSAKAKPLVLFWKSQSGPFAWPPAEGVGGFAFLERHQTEKALLI